MSAPAPQHDGYPATQQGGYPATQQGGYPAPQQGGYPATQQGGYPATQQGGYPAPQQGGYPQPQQGSYPAPQPGGYPATQQGGYPAPQQGGYPAPQQGGGYPQPQPAGYPATQQGGYPAPVTQQPISMNDDDAPGEMVNDPAYPPGSNPSPYYNTTWAIQPNVFSESFSKQYMADYSSPAEESGVSMSPGFIPPNAVPPNELIEVSPSCFCMPEKGGQGCDAPAWYCCRVCCSGFGHLLLIGAVVGIIVMLLTTGEVLIVLYALLGVAYVIVLLEPCCSCNDIGYLSDIKNGGNFQGYMGEVHSAIPTLGFYVECYHYETRTRTVYYTDSKGRRRSKRERRRVRVTTHRESEPFVFAHCQDLAPTSVSLSGKKATRIEFSRTFQFGDDRTRAAFELQSMNIRERNRNRDRHMAYFENFSIPGFKERMLAFVDEKAKHPCFHPAAYVAAAFFFCSWPYRWWFRKATSKTSYTFVKQLTL